MVLRILNYYYIFKISNQFAFQTKELNLEFPNFCLISFAKFSLRQRKGERKRKLPLKNFC